jgi:2-oxoglutarate ferredoxin oxidoreductase subunit gamma
MLERLLIAGSGGQGIILAGKLLASVAVEPEDVPHVTFFPAYGAEVRGGTSNCQVILSSAEISSPVPEDFDSMLILSQASADKFLPQAADDCLSIIDSSMCRLPSGCSATPVPATEIADQLGNTRSANFVMLGAYVARKNVVSPDAVEKGIRKILAGRKEALLELNIKAFLAGQEQ